MRQNPLLTVLAALALTAPAAASARIIPRRPPVPLGVLVRDSRTIHVLQVESIGSKGVSFKTTATLKGKLAKAPFPFVEPPEDKGWEDLFQVGARMLCFRQGAAANLFVNGCWVLAVEPIAWRGEKEWFCISERDYGVTYDGTVEELHKHVVAILAGRETTITARAPGPRDSAERGRLWRIKAGPKVTDFALSDESPHFVGWGSGDPEEVPRLLRSLRAGSLRERLGAAADLGHVRPATRAVLAGLRQGLRDPVPAVALAAASALARLDAADDRPIEAVKARLDHAEAKVRSAAAATLAALGSRAHSALPALLRALKDKD
jgi:hypothetical protein